MSDAMEIGLFQLENLFSSPNTFLFIDLRAGRPLASVHLSIDRLLKKAQPIPVAQVKQFVGEQKIPHEKPIVLVCGEGKDSESVARDLIRAGFDQIYVVAGGVKGLESEV